MSTGDPEEPMTGPPDRVIRDEVHRDVLVPAAHASILDTREFQRLRYVKQLATCEFVFPSATHNRFAHSLGAYHLAGRLLDALDEAHPGRIDADDAELVQLAALLHDIGHPPFSHLLETPEVFATFRHHESWGREMLTSDTTEVGVAVRNVLGDARFDRLLALLDGEEDHDGVPIPKVLKEIVSSQLDVDRMDYLVRDQANTGAQIGGFDIDRVMRALRIAPEGGLHVKSWGLPAIEAYLVTRYHMYLQVYFHKVNMLTQTYLVRMLSRARALAQQGELALSPALTSMLLDTELDASTYASLHDAHVLVELPAWAAHEDAALAADANRLLSRRDYHKSLRIRDLTRDNVDTVREELSILLQNSGADSAQDLIVAAVRKRGYLPYVQGILLEDGHDVAEHSPIVRALSEVADRVLVFVPEGVRDAAEALVRERIKPQQASLDRFM
jgi:HD superfamily phosphohydrolase